MSRSIAELAGHLTAGAAMVGSCHLALGDWKVTVQSNSGELIELLSGYFRSFIGPAQRGAELITAVDAVPAQLRLDYRDWPREGGKQGRKDEYADVEGGRVIHKVRTGMTFLHGPELRLAHGACLHNANQVINFVCASYMQSLYDRGWQICHASAVARGDRAVMISAAPGGGKSTLALHLLNRGLDYVSNDRVLVRREGERVRISGVPKLPRVNPGTLLGSPRLQSVLPESRRRELRAMSRDALWELEEKYDADVLALFPGCRWIIQAELAALAVLTWNHRSSAAASFEHVSLEGRPDLLGAVMKSPGPFYLPVSGQGERIDPTPEPERYQECFRGTPVLACEGGVDFKEASDLLIELLPPS